MRNALINTLMAVMVGVVVTFALLGFFVALTFFLTVFWNFIAVPVLHLQASDGGGPMLGAIVLTVLTVIGGGSVFAETLDRERRKQL